MYSPTLPLFKYDSCNNRFRLDAQGGLLQLSLQSSLRKRTNSSIADDDRKQSVLDLNARRVLVKAAETETDDFKGVFKRLSENPDPHMLALIDGSLRLQAKQNSVKHPRIGTFSQKSRMRLLRHTARLRADASGLFLTVTYRGNMLDHKKAKGHLELLLLWLKRRYQEAAFLWRMEYQKRGAIHFHIIAFGVQFIPIEILTAYWQKMTGDQSYPDISSISSRRKVVGYVSKYIAKMEQVENQAAGGAVSGFINLPNSDIFVGRFWGIANRKALPLAERMYIQFSSADDRLFNTMRRYARRRWSRLSNRWQGFTLFVDDALQWYDLCLQSMLIYA